MAHESESSSRDGGAPRPPRRWLIPIIITVFALLFMYAAERRADALRQRLAAHEMERVK